MTLYEVEVNGNKLGCDHIWENKTDAQKEVDYYQSVGLSARVIVLDGEIKPKTKEGE